MERFFLGWQCNLSETAAQWLWQRRHILPNACIVVPTAQAGRRLRENLARIAAAEQGAVLGLHIVTPAAFYQPPAAKDGMECATQECELLAWMEVLENLEDWTPYRVLFPLDPGQDEAPGWSYGLATTLHELQRELQEGALDCDQAVLRLRDEPIAENWHALAQLSARQQHQLQNWQRRSHYRALLEKTPDLPAQRRELIIVGITDATEWLIQCWRAVDSCRVLIAAPEEMAEHFDAAGRPDAAWTSQVLPYPGETDELKSSVSGSVELHASTADLAQAALHCAAAARTPSDQLALITVDPSLSATLAQTFTAAGWITHDPQQPQWVISHLQWLKLWLRWLQRPELALLCEMLPLPHSQALDATTDRYAVLTTISQLRHEHLFQDRSDVENFAQRMQTSSTPNRQIAPDQLQTTLTFLRRCEDLRHQWLSPATLEEKLTPFFSLWQEQGLLPEEQRGACLDLAQQLDTLRAHHSQTSIDFWLRFFVNRVPQPPSDITVDAVLDVQGWIELSFDRASHVILCAAHENMLPARHSPHPWLSESTRQRLGLATDSQRHARDAYLFHYLCESRRGNGRVDVLLAKQDASGTALLPSRLLLQCPPAQLPRRVEQLFREIDTPPLNLAWQADWHWTPRSVPVPRKLSITSLKSYLTCPMEFYLQHCLHMNRQDNQCNELGNAAFGSALHTVLELWGKDEQARNLTSATTLQEWFSACLHDTFDHLYGKKLNIALRLQQRFMEQRLHLFAITQAKAHQDGWRILASEEAIHLPLDVSDLMLTGKIDRIDQHVESGVIRLWDYKSSQKAVKRIEDAHLRSITPSNPHPAHLQDPRAVFPTDKATKLWKNLQLPLYAFAYAQQHPEAQIEVGYINLSSDNDAVTMPTWEHFTTAHHHAAFACAQLIAEKVLAGDFTPADVKQRHAPMNQLEAGSSYHIMFASPQLV